MNNTDAISKTNDVVSKAREKALVVSKAYQNPKTISAFIEGCIATLIIGGVQFMLFGFNANALLHWKFWVRTLTTAFGIFVLYRAVVNARFPKTENRESVLDVKEEYKEKLNIKDLKMKEWLKNVYNVKNKVEAFVCQKQALINKYENKIMKCTNARKIANYELKIERLKRFISDEYLQKHLENIHVKYYMVYYSDFQEITLYGNGEVMTRGNYNKAFNRASFNKMWVYVLTTAILGVSIITLDNYSVASVMTSIGSTLFMVITRITTALLEADQLYDKTITASLLSRIDVLNEYAEYKRTNKTIQQELEEKCKEREEMKQSVEIELRKVLEEEYNKKLDESVLSIKQQLYKTIS